MPIVTTTPEGVIVTTKTPHEMAEGTILHDLRKAHDQINELLSDIKDKF